MGQIEDLHLFTQIVEHRSISQAARAMNIAKSAVSRRLSLLEERYGSRLIDRGPGSWELTATGLELYQRALGVVSEMEEIDSDFSDVTQNLAGPLTLSVPRDFGLSFLNTALRDFKTRYPEIQLTIDFDDHIVDLSRENYDFAIRITPKLSPNVMARQIGTTKHQLCASPSYLALNGTPKTVKGLSKQSLLHYGTAKRARWTFIDPSDQPQTIEFQPVLNSNSGVFLLETAINGMGIAWLPDFICQSAIDRGALVSLLPDLMNPDWKIFLIHAENRRLTRRMRLFAEAMEVACLPYSG